MYPALFGSRMGRALKEILEYFEWTRVALFYTDDKTTRKCYSVAQGAMKQFPRAGIHIVLAHETDGERPSDEEVDRFLDLFPQLTRSKPDRFAVAKRCVYRQ